MNELSFVFDHEVNEFVPSTPSLMKEYGGNRVIVRSYDDPEGPTYQFQVDIDDFGCVVAAVNRLVRKFIPTFQPF